MASKPDHSATPQDTRISERGSQAKSFIAMDVMREANMLEANGQKILHLEVGQPGTPAPEFTRDAVKSALNTQTLGYTDALGIAPLRERISKHYQDTYDIDISPERIVVTTGSSGAFMLIFLAAFDVGQRMALPVPSYPAYVNTLKALGLDVVEVETTAQTRWAPTPELVRAAKGAGPLHGLLVASPSNPSGTMLRKDNLKALTEYCDCEGVWFISDEIYHGLTYDEQAETALRYSENAIIINSFSKYYSMTGWRVGWMVLPEKLVRTVERLAQNLYISVPAISQVAALNAFDARDELERNKQVYARNREILLKRLPEFGLNDFLPMDGAFYAYIDVSKFTNDSMDFANRLLHEAQIAVTPGADFDTTNGHRYIRMSYAGSTSVIEEAMDQLAVFMRNL